ncbi:hypothetical protein DH86_00001168 [Scytalidium sp. 3C]|nr:hypothetical protein DH86_00001168 [Scytalidium sp. 3C]
MVCAKCQKVMKATTLATPGVKKKSEIYYGSPASSSKDSGKTSATVGSSGVTKSCCGAPGFGRCVYAKILMVFKWALDQMLGLKEVDKESKIVYILGDSKCGWESCQVVRNPRFTGCHIS